MPKKLFNLNLLLKLLKPFYVSKSYQSVDPINVNRILVLWPSSVLGLLFSCKTYFTSLKQNFQNSEINLVLPRKFNKKINNEEIKLLLGLNKKDSVSNYGLRKVFLKNNDITFLPVIRKISMFTHFISLFSKSSARSGVSKIDEFTNPFAFLFSEKIILSLKNNPDQHVSEILSSQIGNKVESEVSKKIPKISRKNINKNWKRNKKVILLNNEPEDKKHRWSIESMLIFISKLLKTYDTHLYFVEDEMEPEVKKLLESDVPILQFVSKHQLGALSKIIHECDLVVTCNSDIMHLAGLYDVPQISIFGLDNAFNLAPIGENKVFVQKNSNLIDEVTSSEVFTLAEKYLEV